MGLRQVGKTFSDLVVIIHPRIGSIWRGFMRDSFAPFALPHLKALKVENFIEEIKHRKEVRELEKQKFLQELEDRKRAKQKEDFDVQYWLNVINAHKVGANDEKGEAALTSAFGPTTPESTRT